MISNNTFPLSLTQQDIYFDQLHNPSSPMYNIGGYVKCKEVNPDRVKEAHRLLINNNDVFGLRISEDNGKVVQYITQRRNTDLPVIDFSSEEVPKTNAQLWVNSFFKESIFNYGCELYASILIKLSESEYWYVCKCHHLIMDGFGFANWAFEIAANYNKEPSSSPIGNWQEVVQQDNDYEKSKRYQSNKSYWLNQFSSDAPVKIFPHKNESEQNLKGNFKSSRYNAPLSRGCLNQLNSVAAKLKVSIANIFISILTVYFSRAYEQKSITFGLPTHNRRSHIQKGMLGVFTNTSPLSVDVDETQSFKDLLVDINKKQKENFRHQRFPTGHLTRLLSTNDEPYQFSGINFNYLSPDYQSLQFDGEAAEVTFHPQYQEHLPLTVTLFEGGKDTLELQYDYHKSFFNKQDIILLSFRIEWLLKQITNADTLTLSIGKLSILPDSERSVLLDKFVGKQQDICSFQTVHELFERKAKLSPDLIALIYEGQQLSYKVVDDLSSQLAQYLNRCGIGLGSLVGVHMYRCTEMVVSILAILKTGAAYVPLEPSLPQDRIETIVQESKLAHILTFISQKNIFQNERMPQVSAVDELDLSKEQRFVSRVSRDILLSAPAYVIYTSGSTGKPKGVMVPHSALMNRIDWMNRQYGMTEHDKILQKTPLTFDVSIWELFWPLTTGAQLVLAKPEGHKDTKYLCNLIQSCGITKLHFVPSMLNIMLKYGNIENCKSLKQVFCSGEALTEKQVNGFLSALPDTELHNLYGPTEAAIDVSFWHCVRSQGQTIPIGKAIQNTQLLVLNKHLGLTPLGLIGELYISGIGLANGYLNRPELTATAFIDNPYLRENHLASSKKLYKTGDLVRYLNDGNLEYIGRNDTQVKIRGQRIELSEIEHALHCCTTVEEAKVIVTGENKDTLTAFLILNVLDENAISEVETEVSRVLPTYMVPSQFKQLEQWPLSANGKVDVNKLRTKRVETNTRDAIQPKNSIQDNLRKLWSELLNVEQEHICITSNFFKVGGNSLMCTELIHLARQKHLYVLSLEDIFQNPTIAALAKCIQSNISSENNVFELTKSGLTLTSKLSYVQYRIWLADEISGTSNKHNMSGGVKLSGIASIARLKKAIDALVCKNPMLKTRIGLDEQSNPYQYISQSRQNFVSHYDLLCLTDTERAIESNKILTYFCSVPFDITDSALFKVCIISVSKEQTLLYFNFHHIICDGWSVNILFNQLLSIYDKLDYTVQDKVEQLSYFDYVAWQRNFLSTTEAAKQKMFWKSYLTGCNQQLTLPFRRLRASNPDIKLAQSTLTSKHLSNLTSLAELHNCSLTNIIQCAVSILLCRVTSEQDFLLGVPVSGRNIVGTADICGPFVNNLPLRVVVDETLSFSSFLLLQKQNLQNVLSNQELPFEEILSELPNVNRSTRDQPLLQVCLNFLSLPSLQLSNENLRAELEPTLANDNKFDLTFYVSQESNHVLFKCSYARHYCHEDITGFLNQLIRILQQISFSKGEMACSELSLKDSVIASPNKQAYLCNQTISSDWPGTIVTCFEQCVKRNPQALALSFNERDWSYEELNNIASLYAQKLEIQLVEKGDVVAILANRSERLVITILAILKVGAAFLILPPEDSENRIIDKLSIVGDLHLLNLLNVNVPSEYCKLTKQLLNLDFDALFEEKASGLYAINYLQGRPCEGDDLAYIAFTSGTQGSPKAIKGRHSSLTAYMPWFINKFGISQSDKFAMLSGLSHDPLQREIFTALMANASIHIPNEWEYDFANVSKWIKNREITVLNITPSLAELILLNSQPLNSVKLTFMCGEPLTMSKAENIINKHDYIKLVNLYGATESCRALSYFEVTPQYLCKYDQKGYVPLGRGFEGVQILVLNKYGQECGVDEIGQIAIRAHHLTLGYLGDEQQTSEKFITNRCTNSESDLIYLTGDYGRFDQQGQVHFCGRSDHQVKIRGFRVELAEVETLMNKSDLIDNTAVRAYKNASDEYQISAYIVLSVPSSEVTQGQLYLSLKQVLPEYMLPKELFFVDGLPLNSNGKVDWSKLYELKPRKLKFSLHKPEGQIEEKLHKIWMKVLEQESVCVLDDFFDVGGNSVSAMRLLTEFNDEFSINMPFSTFFEKSTIREVGDYIKQLETERMVVNHHSNKKNKISI